MPCEPLKTGRTKRDPVRETFDRLAPCYERRWTYYVEATNAHTLRFLRLRAGARVLDVGCGTGPLLAGIVRASAEVYGVGLDLSPKMLAVARQRLGGRQALVRGDVTHLPFGNGSFDCVVSASSLHFWRHPGPALAEINRVLGVGGQLVLTDWCDDFWACRLCDRLLRLVSRAHQRIFGSRECAALLGGSGFTVVALERYKINWLWGLMTASATPRERSAS